MAFSPLRATDYPYLFSGAMLVFETEVMELCRRDLYYVEKVRAGSRFPWARWPKKWPLLCRIVFL